MICATLACGCCQVLTFLLTPVDLPGAPRITDDQRLKFERKTMADGRMTDLTFVRRPGLIMDDRQRAGDVPPNRSYVTMPRSTSTLPVPVRELTRYKQVGCMRVQCVRNTLALPLEPRPRPPDYLLLSPALTGE